MQKITRLLGRQKAARLVAGKMAEVLERARTAPHAKKTDSGSAKTISVTNLLARREPKDPDAALKAAARAIRGAAEGTGEALQPENARFTEEFWSKVQADEAAIAAKPVSKGLSLKEAKRRILAALTIK